MQWTLVRVSFFLSSAYAIPESLAPSLHCLSSASSGPAHVPLQSAQVLFGMRDSVGTMRMFHWTAFIHAGLAFALFPLSNLGAQGCYFDFYDIIVLQCGTMFFPFDLTDGLYLAVLVAVSVVSCPLSTLFLNSLPAVLVAQK